MQYITTTELRTKSSQIVKTLSEGGRLSLIHRSKVIGEILPTYEPKPFDPEAFRKLLRDIKPKRLIPKKDREKVYRKHLEEKYGKDIS
ncbi:MAG: hypothetical protein Q8P92_00725 [Candidatus Daviesbacteria bacterium]|nr:hypothetical protein [Candidatus Daviesbacteria bacterium]